MKKTMQAGISLWKTAIAAFLVAILAFAASLTGGGMPVKGESVTEAYNTFGLSNVYVESSLPQGTYWTAQSVALSVAGYGSDDPAIGIYYTLDGTEPSSENGTKYTGPFAIGAGLDKSAVVALKAAAIRGAEKSVVKTYKYEILVNVALNKTVSVVDGVETEVAGFTSVIHQNATGASVEGFQWGGQDMGGLNYFANGNWDMNPQFGFYLYTKALKSDTNTLEDMINGNLTTGIEIDLGEVQSVNRFWWESGTAMYDCTSPVYSYPLQHIRVEASADGENFTTVYNSGAAQTDVRNQYNPAYYGGTRPFADYRFSETVNARYVRFFGITGEDAGRWYVRLSKFKVFYCDYEKYEQAENESNEEMLLSDKGTAKLNFAVTGENTVADDAAKVEAFERQIVSSDWSNAAGATYYVVMTENGAVKTNVTIDLQKEYLVSKVQINFAPERPATFTAMYGVRLEVSRDGETWTEVYSDGAVNADDRALWTQLEHTAENGNNAESVSYIRYFELAMPSKSARYVRLFQGDRTKETDWVALANIHVYGYQPTDSSFLQRPDDVEKQYDYITRADEVLAYLNDSYPTIPFTTSNGAKQELAVTWKPEREYTDADFTAIQTSGKFTYYGVPQTIPDGVDNLYNAAAVATITVNRPSAAAIDNLLSEIGNANLSEEDYTPETWQALQTAIAKAEAVKADAYSKASDIEAAAEDLSEAYAALEESVDTSGLKALIGECAAIIENESDYIAGSFRAFAAAYEQAQTVAGKAKPSETEVANAVAALTQAREGLLEKSEANALQTLINGCKAVVTGENEAEYTQSSLSAYQAKLAVAESAVTDAGSKAELEGALNELQSAFDALTKKGDKSGLNEAIAAAEALDGEKYTPASWAALSDALAAAKETAESDDASQADIDAAKDALLQKKEALAELGDPAELLAKIQSFVEGRYTTKSWEAFEVTLYTARAATEKSYPTQAELGEALDVLTQAAESLVLRGDKTELSALMNESINTQDYLSAGVLAYNKARTAAQPVVNDIDATQEEVDAAVAAITEAKNNLVRKGDKTALLALIEECEGITDGYTSQSLNALRAALADAEEVANDAQATQEEVDAAVAALGEAKNGLKTLTTSRGCSGSAGARALTVVLLAILSAATAVTRRKAEK